MAQIIRITSEALQATIRRLLPSQQGFGEDLQASNVIQPIIDLTPTAEGSALPLELSAAVNFTDATVFNVAGSSTNVATTPGFYRIIGTSTCTSSGAQSQNYLRIESGLASKDVWKHVSGTVSSAPSVSVDFVFYLAIGDTAVAISDDGNCDFAGSVRQIADSNGNIVNPTGFTFE